MQSTTLDGDGNRRLTRGAAVVGLVIVALCLRLSFASFASADYTVFRNRTRAVLAAAVSLFLPTVVAFCSYSWYLFDLKILPWRALSAIMLAVLLYFLYWIVQRSTFRSKI